MPTSNFQPIRLLDPDCCYKFAYLMANSADPDQLASSEANWSGSTLFAKQDISGFSRTRVMTYVARKFPDQRNMFSSLVPDSPTKNLGWEVYTSPLFTQNIWSKSLMMMILWCFTSLSTLFQPYQDNEGLIMKDCAIKWKTAMSWTLPPVGIWTRASWSKVLV